MKNSKLNNLHSLFVKGKVDKKEIYEAVMLFAKDKVSKKNCPKLNSDTHAKDTIVNNIILALEKKGLKKIENLNAYVQSIINNNFNSFLGQIYKLADVGYIGEDNQIETTSISIYDDNFNNLCIDDFNEERFHQILDNCTNREEQVLLCVIFFVGTKSVPKLRTDAKIASGFSKTTFHRILKEFQKNHNQQDFIGVLDIKNPIEFYKKARKKYWSDEWKIDHNKLRECIREQILLTQNVRYWKPYFTAGFLLIRLGWYCFAFNIFEELISQIERNPETLLTPEGVIEKKKFKKHEILADCYIEQSVASMYLFYSSNDEKYLNQSFDLIRKAHEVNRDDPVGLYNMLAYYNCIQDTVKVKILCEKHKNNSLFIEFTLDQIKRNNSIDIDNEMKKLISYMPKMTYKEREVNLRILRKKREMESLNFLRSQTWFKQTFKVNTINR